MPPAAWAGFTVLRTTEARFDALDRKVRESAMSNGVALTVTETGYDLHGRPRCTAVRMNPDAWAAPLAGTCLPALRKDAKFPVEWRLSAPVVRPSR